MRERQGTEGRNIVWFSCGAPSAVAAWLAVRHLKNVWVVYENLFASEHPDNVRFLCQVRRWIKHPIIVIRSKKYASVDEVFEKERYMAGIAGARCTVEMKKVPRFEFQEADDTHIFGLAFDEQKRIADFERNNPELSLDWILKRKGLTEQDCRDLIQHAGIELPAMYRLGFKHNNCIGCVKATSPDYWQRVRYHFPEVFERRSRQSREIGCKLVRIAGERRFLDELPEDHPMGPVTENISCGPQCFQEVFDFSVPNPRVVVFCGAKGEERAVFFGK